MPVMFAHMLPFDLGLLAISTSIALVVGFLSGFVCARVSNRRCPSTAKRGPKH